MFPITEFTKCLQCSMTRANIDIFLSLVTSFLSCRYEITTRGLSRYSRYSLRHIFRFLSLKHDWLSVRISFFSHFIYKKDQHYIVAVDEVVEGKSGRHSFGLSNFYSSCHQKSIQGVCFFALSLINVNSKTSSLIHNLQVVYSPEDKARIAAEKEKKKQGKQRTLEGKNLPKGRKKKEEGKKEEGKKEEGKKEEGKKQEGKKQEGKKENVTASFRVFKVLFVDAITALKKNILGIKITHLVADSAYGSLDYLQVALANACFLISKTKSTAALYEPVVSKKDKRGRPKIYGKKIDLENIDKKYLKKTEHKDGKIHYYYQFNALSKALSGVKLNVVVLITTNEKNQKSTNIWFTNDMELAVETLLHYYALRFQIEFNFRDAKQHFGLADFKNYTEDNLTNFTNLSFTMCLVSQIILEKYRIHYKNEKLSILDLKITYNAMFNAKNIIKYLRLNDDNNFYSNLIDKYTPIDLINRT